LNRRGQGFPSSHEVLALPALREKTKKTTPGLGPASVWTGVGRRSKIIGQRRPVVGIAEDIAERERAQAAARTKYLDGLVGREDEVWRQTEELIDTKNPARYDEAIQLLRDLKDLSTRTGQAVRFKTRLGQLRDRHARKPSLLRRIDDAGLR